MQTDCMDEITKKEKPASIAASGEDQSRPACAGIDAGSGTGETVALHLRLVLLLLIRERHLLRGPALGASLGPAVPLARLVLEYRPLSEWQVVQRQVWLRGSYKSVGKAELNVFGTVGNLVAISDRGADLLRHPSRHARLHSRAGYQGVAVG
jgi:hypothetical protein